VGKSDRKRKKQGANKLGHETSKVRRQISHGEGQINKKAIIQSDTLSLCYQAKVVTISIHIVSDWCRGHCWKFCPQSL